MKKLEKEKEVLREVQEILDLGDPRLERICTLADTLTKLREAEDAVARELGELCKGLGKESTFSGGGEREDRLSPEEKARMMKIEDLGLSSKVYNCLTDGRSFRRLYDKYGNIKKEIAYLGVKPTTAMPMKTVADILNFPGRAWTYVWMFGEVMAKELERKMAEAGYPNFRVIL